MYVPMRWETLLMLFYARPRPKSRGLCKMGKSVLKAGIFGKSEAEDLEEKLHQLATKQIVREIFLRGATPAVRAVAVPEVEGQTGDAERSAGLPTGFGCFRADRPVAAIEDVGEMVPGLSREPAKVRQRLKIAVWAFFPPFSFGQLG